MKRHSGGRCGTWLVGAIPGEFRGGSGGSVKSFVLTSGAFRGIPCRANARRLIRAWVGTKILRTAADSGADRWRKRCEPSSGNRRKGEVDNEEIGVYLGDR